MCNQGPCFLCVLLEFEIMVVKQLKLPLPHPCSIYLITSPGLQGNNVYNNSYPLQNFGLTSQGAIQKLLLTFGHP